jgi:hypothetical protein
MAIKSAAETKIKTQTPPFSLDQLRKSGNPALERIAKRAAENMRSSAYTSHTSHHSAHN